jgi:Aspartate racemase
VTADARAAAGIDTVGVLGTKPVMSEGFYQDRLADHGIDVVVPGPPAQTVVDKIIFEELTYGVVREASRGTYREVIDELTTAGAEGSYSAARRLSC